MNLSTVPPVDQKKLALLLYIWEKNKHYRYDNNAGSDWEAIFNQFIDYNIFFKYTFAEQSSIRYAN